VRDGSSSSELSLRISSSWRSVCEEEWAECGG
jgi:hypothetical protein